MVTGPLYGRKYKPQFSGHETFPLRYGWLKKACDEVCLRENDKYNKSIFINHESIATFGVGKNMVHSIRYWAQACNVIVDLGDKGLRLTSFGKMVFAEDGLDPYMESPATLWLLHWFLCGRDIRTTWFYAFGNFQRVTFDREVLVKELLKLAEIRGWRRVSATTVKRDVECFVRTYAPRRAVAKSHEESLESPLVELGLLKAIGKKDGFRFVRGEKSTLGECVFAFAVIDFWQNFSTAKSLSFEVLAHEPGSPGRVFALDEDSLAQRLSEIEDATDGLLQWSETAGLKQIIRKGDLDLDAALARINGDYLSRRKRKPV